MLNPLQHDKASLKPAPPVIRKRPQMTEQQIRDTLSDDFIPPCEDFLEFMRPGFRNPISNRYEMEKLT